MKPSELFFSSPCSDEMNLAERELAAFMAAVEQLFGAEQARRSAEEWLDEWERMDGGPGATRKEWRTVTIAASVRLARRMNVALGHPSRLGTSLSESTTIAKRTPMPLSDQLDSIPLL